MKKILFLLALLSVGSVTLAQIKKPQPVAASESRQLWGVIAPLSESQTYSTVFPVKLTYWAKGTAVPGVTFSNLTLSPSDMKAKNAGNTPGDYAFTVITPGMQNVLQGSIVPKGDGTKVVRFEYTYPCQLTVGDKDGKLLKTFILSDPDTKKSIVVGSNFLADAGVQNKLEPVGFTQSDADILKWIDANRKGILLRMEYNISRDMLAFAGQVISYGYGFPKLSYKPFMLDLDKKEKANFPELNQAVEKLRSETAKAYSAPADDQLRQQLKASGDYFASQYTDESTKEMTQLCSLNAGLAYLLSGDNENSYVHLLKASEVLGIFSSATTSVYLYDEIVMLNQLRDIRGDFAVVMQPYSVADRKQMEKAAAEMLAQQQKDAETAATIAAWTARNVQRQSGYVVTKTGEKIEGAISLRFVNVPSTQNDILEVGKSARVTKDGKTKNYRPGDVNYIMVGNDRYEAFVPEWSLFSSFYYGKLLYQNGKCTALVDLISAPENSYMILKESDKKAVSFTNLLKNTEATKAYVGNCPELQALLDKNAITNDEAGVKKFVDLLNGSLQ